ncbi:hypothetical protein GCM10010412_099860 [Nonomuraea recticatena]|uniref:Uncharacterized protein n=1 Tax=Nonomuraea recticatena TaxID=46178 RepID=A0ABN3TG25_9ACTN
MATSTSTRGSRRGKARCLEQASAAPDEVIQTTVRLTGAELLAGHSLAAEAGISFSALVARLIEAAERKQTAARSSATASSTPQTLPGLELLTASGEAAA